MEPTKEPLRLGRRAQHPGGAGPLGTSHRPRSLADIQILFAIAALLVPTGLSVSALTAIGQTARHAIAFPTSIQWNKQMGVTMYRLQIAADEDFHDVFFDRRVSGSRYVVSDLSPGYYYWRVAPAESQSGEFSCPVRFFVSGGIVTTVRLPNRGTGTR